MWLEIALVIQQVTKWLFGDLMWLKMKWKHYQTDTIKLSGYEFSTMTMVSKDTEDKMGWTNLQ